jgi:TPR repeat protein
MKKTLSLTVVCCLIAGMTFGQKKVLNEAKNEIKNTTPNLEDARKWVNEAMNNPETANEAETWFVAGSIENKQFDMENAKVILEKTPDEALMYSALDAILPYFEKAYELDNLPNEKGKVKPKHSKDIRAIMKANRNYYINGGSYYFDNQNWEKSYQNFKLYLDLPALPLMEGEKWTTVEADTFISQIKFYTGVAASQIPDHQAAVAVLSEIKNGGYRESDVYRQLSSEYDQLKDSVALLAVLKEGVTRFPGDEYFLLNLIDRSIQAGNLPDAIAYIQVAIEQNPDDVVLRDALGVIYENSNEPAKAVASYEKALLLDADNLKALKHLGMFYYNSGVRTRAAADDNLQNKSAYEEKSNEALDCYRKAIPFLERAHELDSTDRDIIFCLRGTYYSLGMDKFEEMDALYTKGQE